MRHRVPLFYKLRLGAGVVVLGEGEEEEEEEQESPAGAGEAVCGGEGVDDDRPSGAAEGGRRAARAPAAVDGGRRGGVRLRARDRRVPARPRGARHAPRLPLPRPHRLPLPWSRVREPVPQVRGAGARRRRGGRPGAGASHQGHGRKAHRQVRHQVLHGR